MAVDDACLSFFVSDYKGVLIKQREYVEIKACNNKAPSYEGLPSAVEVNKSLSHNVKIYCKSTCIRSGDALVICFHFKLCSPG